MNNPKFVVFVAILINFHGRSLWLDSIGAFSFQHQEFQLFLFFVHYFAIIGSHNKYPLSVHKFILNLIEFQHTNLPIVSFSISFDEIGAHFTWTTEI